MSDTWQERLSEYLDDELDAPTRAELEAHLEGCPPCRRVLADLRTLQRAARNLPERAVAHDLWPGLARQLDREPRPRRRLEWALAFAAGVLVTGSLWVWSRGRESAPSIVAQGESYLLLLHDPEALGAGQSAAERAAIAEQYGRWAQGLGERCVGGEELLAGGELLQPDGRAEALPLGEFIGGYFQITTRDHAEALALARTCPHLARGGSIELRRIATH
jgi:hypothetical protein